MVELFTFSLLSQEIPGPRLGPDPLVTQPSAPHASTVTRTLDGTSTRIAMTACVLVPETGFPPALCHPDLTDGRTIGKVCPGRPRSVRGRHWVEPSGCSAAVQRHSGLSDGAPIALGEPVSWRPSATSRHQLAGGKPTLPSFGWWPKSQAVSVIDDVESNASCENSRPQNSVLLPAA